MVSIVHRQAEAPRYAGSSIPSTEDGSNLGVPDNLKAKSVNLKPGELSAQQKMNYGWHPALVALRADWLQGFQGQLVRPSTARTRSMIISSSSRRTCGSWRYRVAKI